MTSNDWAIFFTDNARRPAGYRQALLIDGEEYGFRWIPSGEFEMGSPESEEDRYDNETLHHVILTKGFWLLETPVTQRLYHSVVGTNPSKFSFSETLVPCLASQFGKFDSFDALLTRSMEIEIEMNLITSDLPVERVNYYDALEFCEELTKLLPTGLKATLPTEAQWEYACMAGAADERYGELDAIAWYLDNSDGHAHEVGQKGANAWGLYDMLGNVWEWCYDLNKDYPMGNLTDYAGPRMGLDHVCRGGSWSLDAAGVSSSRRSHSRVGYRGLGFRLALVRKER